MPNAGVDCKGDSTNGTAHRTRTEGSAASRAQQSRRSDPPTAAIVVLDVLLGLRAIGCLQVFPVPLQLLANAVGDVAQQGCLRQRTGVIERTGSSTAGLARLNPLRVMADGIRYERRRRRETRKILFRQEGVPAVISQRL